MTDSNLTTASLPKILYVEDEKDLRELTLEGLTARGWHVDTAENGEEALRLMAKSPHQYELILCDVSMPLMDGLQFYRNCLERYGDIPLVILSGFGTIQFTGEALRLGAIDYITKPFEMADLCQKMPIWIEIGRRRSPQAPGSGTRARMETLLRLKNSSRKKAS